MSNVSRKASTALKKGFLSFYETAGYPVSVFLVFLLTAGSAFASMLLDKVVAVVNSDVITWSEMHRAMEFEMTGEVKAMSAAEKSRIFRENEAVFLEGMIDKMLQLQAARKLDIEASKEDISEGVEGIRKKYSMNEKEFAESLKKEGFSLEEYKKLLADQIIINKIMVQQVRNKIVISDEDIKEYTAKNSEPAFRIRQIFFRKSVKGEDAGSLEKKAEEALRKLNEGVEFSAVAAQMSDDPSARTGGDLGLIKKEYLAKEFINALSGMKAGDVSRPFWTTGGLHIIRLEEKMDAGNMAEMRETVRKKLFEARFAEAYKNWVRSLREKAFVEIRL